MITVTGSETPMGGTLFPEDKLDEPRDNQVDGLVGMEFELGSQMNWRLTSIREHGPVQHYHTKNVLAKEIRNT